MQEIRQVMSWDTTDAESGAVRMERAFERIEKAEKRAAERSAATQAEAKKKKTESQNTKGHGEHGVGDFGMGVHDFLMGRHAQAIFRFGSAAKLAAEKAVAMNVVLEAGGVALDYAKGEIEKTTLAAERLEQSFLKVSKAATFSTVGEGTSKLSGTVEALDEQLKGGKQQDRDLEFQKDLISRGSSVSNWSAINKRIPNAFGVMDWWREKRTGLGVDGLQEQNRLEMEGTQRQRGNVLGKYRSAQARDTESAYDRIYGNPYDAQRRSLGDKESTEIADARSKKLISGDDDPALAQIRQRYAIEKEGIDRAEAASERQIELEREIVRAREEGGDVEAKTAKLRMDAAGKTMSLYLPWTQEFKKAQNSWLEARNAFAAAERDSGIQTAMSRFDQQRAAILPGENETERAARDAQLSIDAAKEKLRLYQEAKGVAADIHEIERLNLAIITAETQQELLRRQQAGAVIDHRTQAINGARDVDAAGARLHGASPEEAERLRLQTARENADDEHRAARAKAHEAHWDSASRAAVTSARHKSQKAGIDLNLFDKDFQRNRSRELVQAQGETGAARWSMYGRSDLAQITSERAQSRLGIEDAEFHHNQPLADERRTQQGYHEREALTKKYLNPDGTRRNPADVQREELENRRKQTRIDQFFGGTREATVTSGLTGGSGVETAASRHLAQMDEAHNPAARLAKADTRFQGTALSGKAEKVGSLGLGLTGVEHGMDGSIIGAKDALTGAHLNARQVAEHMHTMKATAATHAALAKDDRSDREIQQEIYKILDARLPKEP